MAVWAASSAVHDLNIGENRILKMAASLKMFSFKRIGKEHPGSLVSLNQDLSLEAAPRCKGSLPCSLELAVEASKPLWEFLLIHH
eukprot:s3812_g2.t1